MAKTMNDEQRQARRLANLALGRGQRPKLNHPLVGMRLAPHTREVLEHIAVQYKCFYGNKPHIAGLLSKIAAGELLVVPMPPDWNQGDVACQSDDNV